MYFRKFTKNYRLTEVLVLVGEFLHHFQGVGLDVFLEHLRGGVAGDLHDVVQIHAGQIHEGGTGAASSVAVDQLVLLNLLLLGRAAFGGLNLDQLREPGPLGDFLDVAVDDLIGQVRNLVVVLLQN